MSCCRDFKKSPSVRGFPYCPWIAEAAKSCVHFLCAALHVLTGSRLYFTSHAILMFLFSPFSFLSFLPFSLFLFSFCFFLFPFCSLDAAKRKAWKLNRVGSLRNIYSSSSTNTEGNKPTHCRWTPPLLPFIFYPVSSLRLPLPQCRHGNQICPKHACFHLMFAESFHLVFSSFFFVCVVCAFYFAIHVPFSLLKF